MLSIGIMAGGQGRYYLELAREDYYLGGGEPVGRWWGAGAERLGLSDKIVGANALHQLLSGFDRSGKPLVQNAGNATNKERRPGFDLTFSAPKTVSALWAVAPENVRREIQAAQDAAVKSALDYLQKEFSFTRTGKAGISVHRCGLAVALFEHGTSRALDPQLHTHALLINVGVMEDGKSRALVHTHFFQQKMTAGALYRAQLAQELQVRLGVEIAMDPTAYRRGGMAFKIVGVSEALCEFWSKRRAAIEKEMGEHGVESAFAAAIAAKETRDIKEFIPARSELFKQWRQEAGDHGFTLESLRAVLNRTPARTSSVTFEDIFAKTLRELTATPESQIEMKSIGGRMVQQVVNRLLDNGERAFGLNHFSESLLLRRVAENAAGSGLGAIAILDAFKEALKSHPELIRIKEGGGEAHFTTRSVLELEDSTVRIAEQLSKLTGHGVRAAKVLRAIKAHDRAHPNEKLGAERKAAIQYLMDSKQGSIRCLEGWAGTAKTSALAIVKDLYEAQGYRVIGTAVAGKAERELAKAWRHDTLLAKMGSRAVHAGVQVYKTFRHQGTKQYNPDARTDTCTLALFEKRTSPTVLQWAAHRAHQVVRTARGKQTWKWDPLRLDSKTVIVCDEASMVETRQMAMLVEKVKAAGALLILVGDRHQLQAVGRGGSFAYIADEFGKAELRDIVRQRDEPDRQAVRDTVEGRLKKVLDDYAARGRLLVEPDRDQARDRMIRDWAETERGKPMRESLIVVGTNEEVIDVNTRCQKIRLQRGEISPLARTSVRGRTLHLNDRVIFRANDYSIGVNNGSTGTIVGVNPAPILKTLRVKLDDGRKVTVPLRDYHDIYLGYANTAYVSQGSTVRRVYNFLGGTMQDREQSYVQLSRAIEKTTLYTSEKDAGPGFKALARRMERSREKTLARSAADQHLLGRERILNRVMEH